MLFKEEVFLIGEEHRDQSKKAKPSKKGEKKQITQNEKKLESPSFPSTLIPQSDYTTPLTRRLNCQSRIYADPDGFYSSNLKSKNDLFKESQERVKQHLESIMQHQKENFEDSLREIDEMSQGHEERLERIEKGLKKLNKIMEMKVKSSRKQSLKNSANNNNNNPFLCKSRASMLMKKNQNCFK